MGAVVCEDGPISLVLGQAIEIDQTERLIRRQVRIDDITNTQGQHGNLHSRWYCQSHGKCFDARRCYSHLAGRLAVEIADSLSRQQLVVTDGFERYRVTRRGRTWLEELGITYSKAQASRTRFARPCLDWTERRHHIAGDIGSLLLRRFIELTWLAPVRDSRALRATVAGERGFADLLGS